MRVFCLCLLDAVRELLTHIPASIKSEPAASQSHALSTDLALESELTPLHLAAFSGSEAVVRALLNSQGVQVEGGCNPSVSILSNTALINVFMTDLILGLHTLTSGFFARSRWGCRPPVESLNYFA